MLMMTIVFVFVLTTSPFQMHVLFSKFDFFDRIQSNREYKLFVVFSILLYYLSAAVNSFIYTILSTQFRQCIIRRVSHFKTNIFKKPKKKTSIWYCIRIDLLPNKTFLPNPSFSKFYKCFGSRNQFSSLKHRYTLLLFVSTIDELSKCASWKTRLQLLIYKVTLFFLFK